MRSHSRFSRSTSYYLLNLLLVFLMVFLLLPTAAPKALAESDNSTFDLPVFSDNITEIPTNDTENNTTEERKELQPLADDSLVNEYFLSNNQTSSRQEFKSGKKLVEPDEETMVMGRNQKVRLDIPIGAVREAVDVELIERFPSGSAGMKVLRLIELNAFDVTVSKEPKTNNDSFPKNSVTTGDIFTSSDNITLSDNTSLGDFNPTDNSYTKITGEKKENFRFEKELTITIEHTQEELAGIDIESLHLYYLDEETRQWVPVPSRFDKGTLILTATITHFSLYGEQANPLQNGPGRVMASEVDLHSGAATYSYPIELPPGPGGFKPSLTLTYNSGSVDGMKNKRDMGSWVGIGWSLHMGRISYDLDKQKYNLDLNGGSYELVPVGENEYKTQPDQYYQITRDGNTWDVRDKDGVTYTFGEDESAVQYVYNTSKQYYRWDLGRIEDTNGNTADVTYIQEKTGTAPNDTVRSAYITNISYGNYSVIFTSSWDENDTLGHVRYDNPISSGSQPPQLAPKIMETRRLDSIEILADENLVRKYSFDYTTTSRIHSGDYEGIYYSGTMKLNSITQYGADGLSSLPATTFKYEDKQVYRIGNAPEDTIYSGNPGNPATLVWPYLTKINSGYGGSISFSYTRNPSTAVFNTWTRQSVTTKIIDSGIGIPETRFFQYIGNPAYKGTGWDQEFRGWNEVIETDAAGNPIKHYFYTTGTINGKIAEKLTGKEYQTQWYDNSDKLLTTKSYNWNYVIHNPPATPWLETWQNRVRIGIDSSLVDADLTHFPVLIHLSNNCGKNGQDMTTVFDNLGSNSKKIAVTAYDGQTQLNVEIEKWDTTTKEAWLWVSKSGWTISSTQDTTLYLYYDKDQPDNTTYVGDIGSAAAQAVWDSNFKEVLHMVDFDTSHVKGSKTGNSYSKTGANQPSESTGQIGKAQSFQNNTYSITIPNGQNYIPDLEGTFEFVAKPPVTGIDCNFFSTNPFEPITANNRVNIHFPASNYLMLQNGNPILENTVYVTWDNTWNGNWAYWAFPFSTSSTPTFMKIYRNTSQLASSTRQNPFSKNATFDLLIGGYNPACLATTDEVRISNVARSAAWLKATYYSCWDNLAIFTPCAIELTQTNETPPDSNGTNWLGTWKNRTIITIDHTKINDSLTYFPVLIHLSNNCGKYSQDMTTVFSILGSNSKKIAVTTADGRTQLNIEIEKWDATAKEAWLWVSESGWAISSTQDTTLYLYYDNTQPDNTTYVGDIGSAPAKAVWDNNFRAVYHLSGISGSEIDSTANNNVGSVNGPTRGQTGKVSNAFSFDGNDFVDCGNQAALNITSPNTVEAIIKIYEQNSNKVIVGKRQGDQKTPYDLMLVTAPNQAYIYYNNGTSRDAIRGGISFGTWCHLAGVYNSSNALIYVNGTSNTGSFFSGNLPTTNVNTLIGKRSDGDCDYFNGVIDEVRISNSARSAAWLKATYYTCWDDLLSFDKTSRTRFEYDDYGNISHQYLDGDISTDSDDSVIHREYSYNTTDNILNKASHEWVTDSDENIVKETQYYYDNNTGLDDEPVKGNLTKAQQFVSSSYSVNSTYEYDSFGNIVMSTDFKENPSYFAYDTVFNAYPISKTLPLIGAETYQYKWNWSEGVESGVVKITTTDVNGNPTVSYYDTFNRLSKIVKPGDSFASPSIEYLYNNWGTLNLQNIETRTKVSEGEYLWQKEYFDGLGRVIQTQSQGEDGHTILSNTVTFDERGLAEKQYTSQDIPSALSTYQQPASEWKYSASAYDALGRIVTQTGADGATISHDYSVAWTDNVTNANGFKTLYKYDAFNRLVEVSENFTGASSYATTTYAYDALGNLTKVTDDLGNETSMEYNWLSQKISMDDPDMGHWIYDYDDNGNLISQTDAKNQIIQMVYDSLNRLTDKIYPVGSGMTNINYHYDTYDPGYSFANGLGHRTKMTDASGSTSYVYDNRGRLQLETRTIEGQPYLTQFTYDGADRPKEVTYTNGEIVTQTYNGRGMPYSLSGSAARNIVTGTLYNQLGAVIEINLGNGIKTTFGYYGLDDAPPGYYGRLWEIKTSAPELEGHYITVTSGGGRVSIPGEGSFDGYENAAVIPIKAIPDPGFIFISWTGETETIADIYSANTTLFINNQIHGGNYHIGASFAPANQGSGEDVYQQIQYTWDANGNLSTRYDASTGETETFYYDHLDRLISASGNGTNNYAEVYSYNTIGNILTKTLNGQPASYEYRTDHIRPHAVAQIGSTNYDYDANGNMVVRGSQVLEWDVENRLTKVLDNGVTIAEYVYDGDGNRIKKIENGQEIIYVNKYYEVNLTTANATSYYYLGDRLIAKKTGTELQYVHQDHLSSTSLMTDNSGNQIGTIVKYLPFGEARGMSAQELIDSIDTDKLFTGQRLDGTGLYFYNARYYDPTIGRFISPDTMVQSKANPQCFSRYSYCLNNPLKYIDPSGLVAIINGTNYNEILAALSSGNYNALCGYNGQGGYLSDPLIQTFNQISIVYTNATQAMINATETTTISFGDLDHRLDSTSTKDINGNTTVTINKDIKGADQFYIERTLGYEVSSIANTSFFPDFSNLSEENALLAFDIEAIAGDLLSLIPYPPIAVGGFIGSSGASLSGSALTWQMYTKGRADGIDVTVSFITTGLGFIPYFGLIPAIFQYIYDKNT